MLISCNFSSQHLKLLAAPEACRRERDDGEDSSTSRPAALPFKPPRQLPGRLQQLPCGPSPSRSVQIESVPSNLPSSSPPLDSSEPRDRCGGGSRPPPPGAPKGRPGGASGAAKTVPAKLFASNNLSKQSLWLPTSSPPNCCPRRRLRGSEIPKFRDSEIPSDRQTDGRTGRRADHRPGESRAGSRELRNPSASQFRPSGPQTRPESHKDVVKSALVGRLEA